MQRRATRNANAVSTVLVLLVWLLVAGLWTASPAVAVEAQGLRLDPVEDAVLGDGSVLRPALPPGASVTYPMRLRNTRDAAVEALVYGADATGTEVASGDDNTGVGAWIVADRSRVALEPGQTTVVEVTITRPDDDTVGGMGAIVVQLADDSREELGLDVIQRGAQLLEVAADGGGDGTPVEIVSTEGGGGLLPSDISVEVRLVNPGAEPAAPDVAVVAPRRVGDDARSPAAVGTVAAGATVTTTVVLDVPWWGLIGSVRAEAATVGLTTRSAPVRVAIVPAWAALLLLLAALVATVRARRGGERPFELGMVPGRATSGDDADADDEPGDDVRDVDEQPGGDADESDPADRPDDV